MDRGRGYSGGRAGGRVRDVVQRLVERAPVPRPAVQDRLGPEDLGAARRPNRRPARQGDTRRRHMPDLLRPHDTGRRHRRRVQRPQGRRVVVDRRDQSDQEERHRAAHALLGHARHGGQRQDARHRRRHTLADRHHHDAARRHRERLQKERRQDQDREQQRYPLSFSLSL